MPLYNEEYVQEFSLKDELEQIAEKYGATQVQQALRQVEWLELNEPNKKQTNAAVLLTDAIDYYYSSEPFFTLKESSQQAYRYEMNLFLAYCQKNKGMNATLREVSTPLFLKEYLKPVKKTNTKSKKSAFLRSFLRETFEHYYEEKIDILKRTLSVKVDKNRRPRAFKKEQIEELVNLACLGRESFRNFTIIWTFLGTGIRLNALCTLQIGDVDPVHQEIWVYEKGDKENKVARKITNFSLEVLSKYINFRYRSLKDKPDYQERYIFSDDKGVTPLHDSTVQKMFQGLIQESTLIPKEEKEPYHLSVHSIRHSYALYMLESGVSIYDIKELLGHQWLSSTLVYLKLFDEMLVKVINKHPLGNLKISDFF